MHPGHTPPDLPPPPGHGTGPATAAAGLHAAAGVPGMATLVASIGAAAAALVLVIVPKHEGNVLRGYVDPVGIVTACMGHTRTAVLGRRYTPAECQALLVQDLVMHAKDLACITHPLQPWERAALLSFAFNVGPGKAGVKDGLCTLRSGRPSTIRRLANAGDMAGACASISGWVYATRMGQRLDCRVRSNWCWGLVLRRADERALCEGKFPGGRLGASDPAATPNPAAAPGTASGAAT
jgi:lysozyme